MLAGVSAAQFFAPVIVASQEPATAGPATSGTPDGTLTAPGLAPGDLIEVRMYDFPDLGNGPLRVHVGADGSVHLPFAGTVRAAGLTPDMFQRAIGDSLKSRGVVKEPNVSVEVISAVNLVVRVMGEVITPKSVPLFAPAPISYVLGEVGGYTGLASHHITILHHNDQLPTSFDFDPNSSTVAAANTPVEPGDIVNVAADGIYFIAGEVLKPGIYPLRGGFSIGQVSNLTGFGIVKHNVTLLEALTQAGGITTIAARSKMRLLRTIDGKREEIIVDQVKLYKGEVADPVLQADDIVYVPSSYVRQQTNNLYSTVVTGLYAAFAAQTALK
jgi:polysaccharide export outer membrane protein